MTHSLNCWLTLQACSGLPPIFGTNVCSKDSCSLQIRKDTKSCVTLQSVHVCENYPNGKQLAEEF